MNDLHHLAKLRAAAATRMESTPVQDPGYPAAREAYMLAESEYQRALGLMTTAEIIAYEKSTGEPVQP